MVGMFYFGKDLHRLAQYIGLNYAKTSIRAYADIKGQDPPAHPCSLIRALLKIIGYCRMYEQSAKALMTLCARAG